MGTTLQSHPHGLTAWRQLADATAISAGTLLLDVGCGDGGFCEFAAARGASVCGLDSSPAAIERVKARLPGDFRVGRMEALPWPDGSFDVVTGFNAFQYAVDVDSALAEAVRVARRGGRLAICKWGRPQDNEFFRFLIACGVALPASTRAADPIDGAIHRAGVAIVDSGEIRADIRVEDSAAFEAALAATGAFQSDTAQRCLRAAEPFRQPDGSFRFRSHLRYMVAVT